MQRSVVIHVTLVLARAVLCRVSLMNHHVRLRECTYDHCTGCGAVRGQVSRLMSLLCVWGAAEGLTRRSKASHP